MRGLVLSQLNVALLERIFTLSSVTHDKRGSPCGYTLFVKLNFE